MRLKMCELDELDKKVALEKLKNTSRSPGQDSKYNKLLKYGGANLKRALTKLFGKIIEHHVI